MLITLCLASATVLPASAQPERIGLEGQWRLTQAERKIDIPATVPGVVQLDLLRAGKIADPFVGLNDRKAQWVGEVPWTYTRTFDLSPSFLKRRRIVLRCEGLDTLGRVAINGQEIAQPDDMHRTWEFDVRRYLKAGRNAIRIDFAPIEPYLKAHEVQAEFPDKPVQSHGWGYVRKPSFQMGWDFSPKLVTAGIWRKIGLIGWDEARLTDVEIVQDHRAKDKVGLDVKLTADTEDKVNARFEVLFKGRKVAGAETPLQNGSGEVKLAIRNPQLWWPHDMGPQNLYDIRVTLRDASGKLVDQGARRIGLRTITWFAKTEKSPLGIAINGRRLFAKGSNWVPPDSLLVRTTTSQTNALVQKAVDAHMNLMRLWGGGYYENDALFDACDEKGLLLWFEFKFADATYPAFDPKWLSDVKAEAQDNVRRVRHHPSIAVYSGNNEVIGFISEKTTPSSMSREDYDLLFHKTLRDVVHDLAPDAFYTPGSPEIGDDHYWDVWHGSATFASYRDRHGFMSEYGFQAFPVPKTVEAFTTPKDRTSVETPVMLNHQRNWRDGNALIVSTMRRYYRQPKDFDSTLWLSQINQADGILMGVEHWRRDWPHSTASLVWQFNDPWPVVSWSMIDYYGRPKALYYKLKHAYAPLALSGLADEKGKVELWIVNDRPQRVSGAIDWKLVRTDGKVVAKGSDKVATPEGTSSFRAANLDFAQELSKEGAENLILWANLRSPGEPSSETTLLFGKPKDVSLRDPSLRATVKPLAGGFAVTLSASRPALDAWIDLKGVDADYSDNFVTLLPNEPKTIVVHPTDRLSLAKIRQAIHVRSLQDTYAPGTGPNPIVHPKADGSLDLTADDAEIVGDGLVLEIGAPSNIGNWQRVEDSLRWTVKGAHPGVYAVTASVAIPDNEAGSTFEVEVEGQRVTATVPATGSWTTYKTIEMGQVTIDKGGDVKIRLKPLSLKQGHVMNLRSVVLKRVF